MSKKNTMYIKAGSVPWYNFEFYNLILILVNQSATAYVNQNIVNTKTYNLAIFFFLIIVYI